MGFLLSRGPEAADSRPLAFESTGFAASPPYPSARVRG
jgi:hypothetical protein